MNDQYEARVRRIELELVRVSASLMGAGMMFRWLDPFVLAGPEASVELAELERIVGPLPPALWAWYRRFELVDLSGWIEDWHRNPPEPRTRRGDPSRFFGDPLVVRSPAELIGLLEAAPARHGLPFAADARAKERCGAGQLWLTWRPGDGDALVEDGTGRSFLAYVEGALSWLGFPGWADYENVPEVVRARRASVCHD